MEQQRLTTKCYVCRQALDPAAAAYDAFGPRHFMCQPRVMPDVRVPPCSAHWMVDPDT